MTGILFRMIRESATDLPSLDSSRVGKKEKSRLLRCERNGRPRFTPVVCVSSSCHAFVVFVSLADELRERGF